MHLVFSSAVQRLPRPVGRLDVGQGGVRLLLADSLHKQNRVWHGNAELPRRVVWPTITPTMNRDSA